MKTALLVTLAAVVLATCTPAYTRPIIVAGIFHAWPIISAFVLAFVWAHLSEREVRR